MKQMMKMQKNVDNTKGEIKLKHIEFSYPSKPEVTIFKDLNLCHSQALVGASGSGKIFVIALIERFYDPIADKVTVDGKDIKKLNLKSLRLKIGLVQQEPTLFTTTIYKNILYGIKCN
jgi:ATP-binding cassette subfamily B (MDR/TAP) protein 1